MRQAKNLHNGIPANRVNQPAMMMSGGFHKPETIRTVYDASSDLYIEMAPRTVFIVRMEKIAARMRQRIDELGIPQVDLARALDISPQRLGNYLHGRRPLSVELLAAMAKALNCPTDWLLGLSATKPVDFRGVMQRILELDGMSQAKAFALAQVADEAVQLLASLPLNGDDPMRSQLAAQATWNLRRHDKQ